MENTIKTNQRIFQVLTFDGDYKLINLDGFKIQDSGELTLKNGDSIRSVKHLWNNKFETIDKRQVKTMIQAL